MHISDYYHGGMIPRPARNVNRPRQARLPLQSAADKDDTAGK
jgi:hypothetical protein